MQAIPIAMLLTNGTKYAADINLSWLEKVASDETIKGKFEAIGFTNVVVLGDGKHRTATGIYSGKTEDVELLPEISNVTVVS